MNRVQDSQVTPNSVYTRSLSEVNIYCKLLKSLLCPSHRLLYALDSTIGEREVHEPAVLIEAALQNDGVVKIGMRRV